MIDVDEGLRERIRMTLDDPRFAAAAERVAADLIDEWEMTKPEEVDKREDIYRRHQLLVATVQKLQDLVLEGVPLDLQ